MLTSARTRRRLQLRPRRSAASMSNQQTTRCAAYHALRHHTVGGVIQSHCMKVEAVAHPHELAEPLHPAAGRTSGS
jgi:predicted hydrolase (HD superfamily)